MLFLKTVTLKAALECVWARRAKPDTGQSYPEGLLRWSATSSLPVGVDDIKSAASMEDIAVTFFNAAVHTTVAGSHKPKATVLASSNNSLLGVISKPNTTTSGMVKHCGGKSLHEGFTRIVNMQGE